MKTKWLGNNCGSRARASGHCRSCPIQINKVMDNKDMLRMCKANIAHERKTKLKTKEQP